MNKCVALAFSNDTNVSDIINRLIGKTETDSIDEFHYLYSLFSIVALQVATDIKPYFPPNLKKINYTLKIAFINIFISESHCKNNLDSLYYIVI